NEHGAHTNERGTHGDDERHHQFLDRYPRDMCERHDGPPAVAGYWSCRWNQERSPSLRPRGARSSHCHIVHSPSKPRAYAEYVWNTSSPSRANALMPGCSPDQSRQATFSASSCAWSLWLYSTGATAGWIVTWKS